MSHSICLKKRQMNGDSLSPRNEKISFKKSPNPIEGAFFELADFDYKNRTPSENDKSGTSNSHHQTSEILSTTDIVSAVSYVWGHARQPLSLLLSKTKPTCKSDAIQGGDSFHYTAEKGAFRTFTISDDEPSSGDLTNKTKSTILEQGNTENLKENKKISSSQTIYEFCSLWRMLHGKSTMIDNSSVENCPSSTRIPHNLGSIYLWMSEIALNKQKKPVICVRFEDKTEETTECQIFTSKSDKDSEDKKIVPCNSDCENSMKEIDEGTTYVKANSSDVDFSLSDNKKPQYALAKHEHAFAGAMAGIFVSVCLHPMDTVKTVIQSCRSDQKSLHYIGRSIISERGVTGLYRGISSNLVTSAPISAIYTFTYESVKKTLLPLLPKEYHSFAHCMAGGCASVATSFVFTPSERIKQQMQVGSHYRNCWNALIEVVKKGGLSSLYTGWGAVLCRNVPQSVIKFYTYESLKQIMLPKVQSNAQTTTFVTLVCGGLAGSTASFFTTPFDVVKTRLQTQIPGSTTRFNGVFNTLVDIGKNEGLRGLYRGLTPRLVIYMVQGALFFASYESFKKLFSLEVPLLSTETLWHDQKTKDDSTINPSPLPVSP